MSLSIVIFVVISSKSIDVFVTGERVLAACIIRSLGRTGSDFSVGSDCLNAVKAGPDKKILKKPLKAAPLACPARVTGQLVFTRGSFSGKQKNHSPFTPNNAWTGYLKHELTDKLQFTSKRSYENS